MNVHKVFPSKYVTATDLGGRDVTVTIDRVVMERMGNPPEEKPVMYFENATKGLILNKTNAMAIAVLHGPETDNWAGKRIILYPTRIKAFGAMHDVVRVRPSVPPPPKQESAGPAGGTPQETNLDDAEDVLDEADVDVEQAPSGDHWTDEEAEEFFTPNGTNGTSAQDDTEPRCSEAQAAELNRLGREMYGEKKWPAQASKLSSSVSTGQTERIEELRPREAQQLIDGLTERLSVKVVTEAQPA